MPEMYIKSNALAVAARLGLLGTVLMSSLGAATKQSLDNLEMHAQNYMYSNFEYNPRPPTNQLEEGFTQTLTSTPDTITGQLINPVVYAWRRDRGFTGMTDSLGRTYALDPVNASSMYYMENTLKDPTNLTEIRNLFVDTLDALLLSVSGVP